MKKIFLSLLLLLSTPAWSETTATLTAGPLLSLGSIRLGGADWEAGLLGSGFLGIFVLTRKNDFYMGVGPGVSVHYITGYGLRGALGLERELWGNIFVKLEASSYSASNGLSAGELQAGLTIKLR